MFARTAWFVNRYWHCIEETPLRRTQGEGYNPYRKVRRWSPLLLIEAASSAKSDSSQFAISRALALFSRRYMKLTKPNPQHPQTMMTMVMINGVSSGPILASQSCMKQHSTHISEHTCS
jgi:hypothetical protein